MRTVALLAFAFTQAATLAATGAAEAQVGLGAERYEVTITPPKRPGSEPAPNADSPSPDTTPGAAPDAAPGEAAAPAAAQDSAAPPQEADSAPTAAKVAPAAPRPVANLPMRTLQVGAFRQKGSATTLHEALAASFQDIQVIEVQSGGEPLYRVNVGLMPHGPALDGLKRRLIAAGHPAFEVPAPTAN